MTGQLQLLITGVLLAIMGVALVFVFMPWAGSRLERANQRRGISNAYPRLPSRIGIVGFCLLVLSIFAFTAAGIVR